MGKKKFIDKKKSATFQLFARDSSDPNYQEGPSSDRVFVRVDDNPYSINSFSDEHNGATNDPNSVFADAPDDYDSEDEGEYGETKRQIQLPLPSTGSSLPDHVRREILELGFPDDGYNYLTHLREIKNAGGGSAYYENSKAKLDQLPNDIKAYDASRIHISELNDATDEKALYSVASKTFGARIQKVVDPEVAALLEDSDDMSRFGSDIEELEEDFVINASLSEVPSHMEPEKKQPLLLELDIKKKEINESYGYVPNESITRFLSEDRVGNHMSSAREGSVFNEKPRIRRPLDEQFDLLELQEYGSESEHEYDGESAEENEFHQEPLAEKLNHALKDHVKDELQLDEKYKAPSDLLHDHDVAKDSLESAAILIDRCREYGQKYEKEDENRDEDVVIVEESSDESEIWDCETIVTTYSNLDNHPGKIDAPGTRRKKQLLAQAVFGSSTIPSQVIALKGREKLPVDFLPQSRKSGTEKSKEASRLKTEPPKRKQHGQESKEEKKERKVAVKEERREARRIKKEMKELYKSEGQHAQKVAAFSGPSSIHLM